MTEEEDVLIAPSKVEHNRYFIFRPSGVEVDFFIKDNQIKTNSFLSPKERKAIMKKNLINGKA